MKKIILFLLLAVCHIDINAQLGYWNRSEFINLEPDKNIGYKYVQIEDNSDGSVVNEIITQSELFKNTNIQKISDRRFFCGFRNLS